MKKSKSGLIMYTLQDLVDKTGIGLQTWRKYIKSGELKASKVGRSYLVYPASFQTFIKSKELSPTHKRRKAK